MNYGSGLMLGMSLVQAAKGMLGGSSRGGFGAIGGSGRGNFSSMGKMTELFENNMKKGSMGGRKQSFDASELQLPQVFSQSVPEKNSFELASALPGRRRYRASNISKELAEIMEENLSKLEYVKTIEVNPDTGSVLLTFDDEDLDKIDALAHAIKKRLFSDNYAEYKRDRKLNQVFYGSVTKSIKSTVRHISHTIVRETGGLFDIRSLCSCLLMIFGFRKVILNGEFPSGIQMLWWAVSLMRGIKIA